MWSNVLTVEPFDSDTAGEKGDGAEIGGILQLSIPGAGDKSYVLDRNSVKQQTKALMDSVNAKGISEFSGLLNDFYRQLTTEDMDIDAMTNRAGELADWLLDHHTPERDGYAQEVLDFLAKRRVSLSDGQIGDIEYSYGSLNDFKRAIKGSIILDQNSTTSLDQLWQEAAARFPDRFSSETVEADMPDGLAGIVLNENTGGTVFTHFFLDYYTQRCV